MIAQLPAALPWIPSNSEIYSTELVAQHHDFEKNPWGDRASTPRRHQQAHHRAATTRWSHVVRHVGQEDRIVRGRGTTTGAADARHRRDADRGGHRPAQPRLPSPGDDRDEGGG